MKQDKNSVRPTEVLRVTDVMQQTIMLDPAIDSKFKANSTHNDSVVKGIHGEYAVKSGLMSAGEADLFICEKAGKEFVLKLYKQSLPLNPEKREAYIKFLYQQKHPNIVPLVDYGKYQGRIFDISPYYKRGDLSSIALTVNFIVKAVIPNMTEALKGIHEAKLIHRDLKPQNILMNEKGESVAVGDFGILSLISDTGNQMTRTLSRTMGYAPPELYKGITCKESDYYSMGITLLQMIRKKDVFHGMNDHEIMSATDDNTIPTLDRMKIKSRSGELTQTEKIEQLIVGLTEKSVSDRWGYTEVQNWMNGKPVLLKKADRGKIWSPKGRSVSSAGRNQVNHGFNEPFIWGGNSCFTLEAIARALGSNWDQSKKEIRRGTFVSWMKTRRPDISSKLFDIMEDKILSRKENADVALFNTIYAICPTLRTIYWKGKEYKDMATLAQGLSLDMSHPDSSMMMMIRLRVWSRFLREHNADSDVIKRVETIETLSLSNQEEAFYRFVFFFLPKGTARVCPVGELDAADLKEMVNCLQSQKQEIRVISRELLNSARFAAWLGYYGQERGFKEYLDKSNQLAHRPVIVLLNYLDTLLNGNEIIRELALNYSELSHIYWIQQHLDDYEYHGEESQKIRRTFAETTLDVRQTVGESIRQMSLLNSVYQEFRRLADVNPYLISYGITQKNHIRSIHPKIMGGYFLNSIDGTEVTLAYARSIGHDENDPKSNKLREDMHNNAKDAWTGAIAELNGRIESIKSDVNDQSDGNILEIGIRIFFAAAVSLGELILGIKLFYESSNYYILMASVAGIILPVNLFVSDISLIEEKAKGPSILKKLKKIENKVETYKNESESYEHKIQKAMETSQKMGLKYENTNLIESIQQDLHEIDLNFRGQTTEVGMIKIMLCFLTSIANALILGTLILPVMFVDFNSLLNQFGINSFSFQNMQGIVYSASIIGSLFYLFKYAKRYGYEDWLGAIVFSVLGLLAIIVLTMLAYVAIALLTFVGVILLIVVIIGVIFAALSG